MANARYWLASAAFLALEACSDAPAGQLPAEGRDVLPPVSPDFAEIKGNFRSLGFQSDGELLCPSRQRG